MWQVRWKSKKNKGKKNNLSFRKAIDLAEEKMQKGYKIEMINLNQGGNGGNGKNN
jgi:hypothetical protein